MPLAEKRDGGCLEPIFAASYPRQYPLAWAGPARHRSRHLSVRLAIARGLCVRSTGTSDAVPKSATPGRLDQFERLGQRCCSR
jgi:hypothetical protein